MVSGLIEVPLAAKQHTPRWIVCATVIMSVIILSADQSAAREAPSQPDKAMHATLSENYGKLPLSFEANHGQTDKEVKFLSRGAGYTLFLTPTEAVFSLRQSKSGESDTETRKRPGKRPSPDPAPASVIRMQLIGAQANPTLTGEAPLPGKSHYLRGNDPKKWRTHVPHYAKVRYEAVYPGIDLVYYGNQRQLEYDFVVAPGTDYNIIRMAFKGTGKPSVDSQGNLVLETPGGQMIQRPPIVYQEDSNGQRQTITAHYVLKDNAQIGFRVASYDAKRELVIDPVLSYSTFLGGHGGDWGTDIAVDDQGQAYVSGITSSSDFPTANALQPNLNGEDAFVAKLTAQGDALVYATYLGGNEQDSARSIAIDDHGQAYISGITDSSDFPTVNALQPNLNGESDAFVAKLNADGNALVYATYLGGSENDRSGGIAVDNYGQAYISGDTSSSDFLTVNAAQPNYGGVIDTFVVKLTAQGNALVYATYIGGSDGDWCSDIAVDGQGQAYVSGLTGSPDFPTVNALQPNLSGPEDAFVAKLTAQGDTLVYATYLGGNDYDWGMAIAVDDQGQAYVSGHTYSPDFPTVNALQPNRNWVVDAFVAKLTTEGNALVYATYLGGNDYDGGKSIVVDDQGQAYVSGSTTSTDFPMINAVQTRTSSGFVAKLTAQGDTLVYTTYLGYGDFEWGPSIAVDDQHQIYVSGFTHSSGFPTVNALQPNFRWPVDAFVAKIGIPGELPGDLNNDSCVDRADTNVLLAGIRKLETQAADYDINHDSSVNRADVRALVDLFSHPLGVPCE